MHTPLKRSWAYFWDGRNFRVVSCIADRGTQPTALFGLSSHGLRHHFRFQRADAVEQLGFRRRRDGRRVRDSARGRLLERTSLADSSKHSEKLSHTSAWIFVLDFTVKKMLHLQTRTGAWPPRCVSPLRLRACVDCALR